MDLVNTMQLYFHGEKVESALIVAVSALLLLTAGALFILSRHPFGRGLAAVLLVTAIVGGSVGGAILVRTDKQVTNLVSIYRDDPENYRETEGARMATVVKSFHYYRVMYGLACLVALAFVFGSGRPALHGIAVGLLLFAALGLTIDYFAQARAIGYLERIQSDAAGK